jgi:hypothetical protein
MYEMYTERYSRDVESGMIDDVTFGFTKIEEAPT